MKHQQISGDRTKQIRPRPRHHSEPCHRSESGEGDQQRKQQNGPDWWIKEAICNISEKNKTSLQTETRGPIKYLMSMTSCSPQQRHLTVNGMVNQVISKKATAVAEKSTMISNVSGWFFDEFLHFNRVFFHL